MPTGLEGPAMGLALKVIEKASPTILAKIASSLGRKVDDVRVQYLKTFQDQFTRTFQRSRYVKTVVSKDAPIDLESIYVPVNLKSDNRTFTDNAVDPCPKTGARFVLSGTGGSGKTFLIKHLLNISGNSSLGLIPIFVELRSIDFTPDTKMTESIYKELVKRAQRNLADFSKLALRTACSQFSSMASTRSPKAT